MDAENLTEHHCQKLAQEVGHLLHAKKYFLSTAESCTGGWLAKCCTDCVGSSKWFDCSVVSYSYSAKNKLLNIDPAIIEKYGAVDARIVIVMAKNLLAISESTHSIAISGIAGPKQETADNSKPVGMVCFAWAVKSNDKITWQTDTQYFDGNREQVRMQSVYHALVKLKELV